MRTLPAIELDVPIQPAWVWLLDGLCLLSVASMALWWLAAASAPGEPLRSALLMISALTVLLAVRARRIEPCHLRWDGSQWFCRSAPGDACNLPTAGRLSVMLDLQWAMMLRFDPELADQPLPSRWMILRCRAMNGTWHLLRCAAFNQPMAGPGQAGLGVEARQ